MTPQEQRLCAAIQCVIRETRGFNERKQEAWCKVCRYRPEDRLHDPECSIYELHGAFEEWAPLVLGEAQSAANVVAEEPSREPASDLYSPRKDPLEIPSVTPAPPPEARDLAMMAVAMREWARLIRLAEDQQTLLDIADDIDTNATALQRADGAPS